MKKIISVEGMSCEHCAAAVKNALESIEAVKSAKVVLKKNEATIKLDSDVADDVIKSAIDGAGFKALTITTK